MFQWQLGAYILKYTKKYAYKKFSNKYTLEITDTIHI